MILNNKFYFSAMTLKVFPDTRIGRVRVRENVKFESKILIKTSRLRW